MKKYAFQVVSACLLVLSLVSCASREKLIYFQGIDDLKNSKIVAESIVFKVGDQLSISVSSLDNEAALPFNLPVASFNIKGTQAVGTPQLQTYFISKDGRIEYPQLGTLKLAGLTRLEAIDLFKDKLSKFLINPVVNIQLLNFNVTVLGEVSKPGRFLMKNERVSLLDAIGMAGDLTIFGTRENVLIIRETMGRKEYVRVDLTTPSFLDSPFYYLQQNDIIYIEPNKPKINSSTNSSTNGLIISTVSLILTVISIALR